MTLSQGLQDDMCRKLRLVGLRKAETLPIVNLLTQQVHCEGPESVVKRLKVLKQAAVNRLAGQPVEFHWISHTSKGPKGPWRPVWEMLSSSQHKHKKRALNAMMVYASLVLPKRAGPTLTQEKKFLGSVSHPETEVDLRKKVLTAAHDAGDFRKGFVALKEHLSTTGWRPNTANIPDVMGFMSSRYGSIEGGNRRAKAHLDSFLGNPAFHPFHSFPQVTKTLGYIGEDYFELTAPWNGAKLDWRTNEPSDEPIGVIGSSQEPGYKFRAFASPNAVLQASMEGLKRNLLEALTQLPWDCTHDQERGVTTVQGWLKEGKTVYSVDLSDATNNFPLSLQLDLLEFLRIPLEDRKLLELVSRSPYRTTWGEKEPMTWDVGQPLGAGPSFMAFALTHAAVALDAEAKAGVELRGSSFLILGDDFVTCDERVHTEYRKLLKAMSCPISESKCLVSSVAGEFAGKLIMQDHIFHGYKFREVDNRSFLAVVRSLGPQAISKKLLSKEQVAYCKLVKEIPEPFGLGFNPKGRSFADRYEEYLVLQEHKDKVAPDTTLVSESERANKLLYALTSRYLRYFPNVRQQETVDPTPVSLSGDIKERLYREIRGTDSLVSSVVTAGDPRPDPLQGWTKKVMGQILPLHERVVESQSERESKAKIEMATSCSLDEATRLMQSFLRTTPSISMRNCLAPNPSTDGETKPERESKSSCRVTNMSRVRR